MPEEYIPDRTMNVRLQQARDIYVNWVKNNPTLLDGEVAVVFDVNGNVRDIRSKTGDGSTKFNDLPWDNDITKINVSELGVPNGVATLDDNGKILVSQLPEGYGTGSGGGTAVKISKVPSTQSRFTYNGSNHVPVWDDFDSALLVASGTLEARDAGTYKASFRPSTGYCWSDGTADIKYVDWTIDRKATAIPVQSNILTYNGSSLSPTWSNYTESEVSYTGSTVEIEPGVYTVSFTPTPNYKWPDDSIDAKDVTWEIERIDGTLSIVPESLTFMNLSSTQLITATTNISGTVSAVSSNTSYATVTTSGNKVTVSPKGYGTCNVTVSAPADNHYTVPASKICSVSVKQLAQATGQDIKNIVSSGNAQSIFAIGDSVNTPLNGTCVNFTANNLATTSQIIGFNHNQSLEYPNKNSMHLILGRLNDKDIFLADSKCGSWPDPSVGFIMNPRYDSRFASGSNEYNNGFNKGGWKDSYMRNTIMSSLINLFPADIRNVISSVTKYTDNVGNATGDTASNVTATTDKLFLLSEHEVFGTRSYANQYEANKQSQYSYYLNGNSKIRYRSDTSAAYYWWLRSPSYSSAYYFCRVRSSGSANYSYAAYSFGVSPAWILGES